MTCDWKTWMIWNKDEDEAFWTENIKYNFWTKGNIRYNLKNLHVPWTYEYWGYSNIY